MLLGRDVAIKESLGMQARKRLARIFARKAVVFNEYWFVIVG
jgi:hypothetical protein